VKILVTRLSALGDVAIMIPVVSSIAQRYPEHHFTVVSMPLVAPLFQGLSNVDFVAFEKRGHHKGLKGILKLFRQLQKKQKFDCIVDLHDVLRTKILRALYVFWGVKVLVIDKGRAEKKELVENGYRQSKQLLPSAERYRNVFASLGLTIGAINKGLPFETITSVAPIEKEFGVKQGYWIGIAPFTQHTGKQLPLPKIETVIDYFSQQPDTTVFLFGAGEKEEHQIEQWQQKYPRVQSVVKRLPFDTEVLLMSKLTVMLTMDSGNLHLASLVDTPVVSVWGATHPYAGFYSINQASENAIQLPLACRPCSIFGNLPCRFGTYACLNDIDTKEIVIRMTAYLK
jgi:ADP-heptose:LPS heptosyltransferase